MCAGDADVGAVGPWHFGPRGERARRLGADGGGGDCAAARARAAEIAARREAEAAKEAKAAAKAEAKAAKAEASARAAAAPQWEDVPEEEEEEPAERFNPYLQHLGATVSKASLRSNAAPELVRKRKWGEGEAGRVDDLAVGTNESYFAASIVHVAGGSQLAPFVRQWREGFRSTRSLPIARRSWWISPRPPTMDRPARRRSTSCCTSTRRHLPERSRAYVNLGKSSPRCRSGRERDAAFDAAFSVTSTMSTYAIRGAMPEHAPSGRSSTRRAAASRAERRRPRGAACGAVAAREHATSSASSRSIGSRTCRRRRRT